MAADVLSRQSSSVDGGDGGRTTPRRRLSMEEDFYYREIMTGPRRPPQPPSYEVALKAPPPSGDPRDKEKRSLSSRRDPSIGTPRGHAKDEEDEEAEQLPPYWCDVHAEGVFMRKMEIEETIKRAEDRNWHMVYVVLHGTALNVYRTKKDWGWGRSKDGPNISPDNPPWIKRASLEHSYSLLHADVGIAADYIKRRYVIRVRAEADQFLLSCVELGNFVKWLENLFAAIDVAAPIEERDFPRDHSIPRIQRLRWFRGQQPRNINFSVIAPAPTAPTVSDATTRPNSSRRSTAVSIAGRSYGVPDPEDTLPPPAPPVPIPLAQGETQGGTSNAEPPQGPERVLEPAHGRLSTTSYPNEAVDPDTGKWTPRNGWTSTHDHLYAKLCYAVLLFKSPRKSNYIMAKGKQWFVDWTTGRMFRVLPPAYDDVTEMFAPWQTITAENRRI